MSQTTGLSPELTRRLISFPELKTRKGTRFSRQWIYRLVAAGDFPKPVHLGDWSIAWLDHEIDEWIDARAAARDSETTA